MNPWLGVEGWPACPGSHRVGISNLVQWIESVRRKEG